MDVALYDMSEEQLEKARPGVELARSCSTGSEAEPDGAAASLRFETDLAAALDGADMVIEAVPEKLELKQQVFAEFEQHVAADAILASNTSGIPITKIAEDLEHPERVIGHALVEPAAPDPDDRDHPRRADLRGRHRRDSGARTADRLLPLHAQEGGARLRREPGPLRDHARVPRPRGRGRRRRARSSTSTSSGASATSSRSSRRWQLLDMAGLDIYTAVASYLNQDLSNEKGVSSTITGPGRQGQARHQDRRRPLRLRRRASRRAAEGARRGARGGAQGAELSVAQREVIICSTAARSSSTRSHIIWNIDAGNPVRFPVYSVLIEHDDGLFLFDTGYDLEHVKAVLPFELPEQTEEQTIPAQLEKAGYKPEDVTGIINSHLHFDHVGGNKLPAERDDLPARGGAAPGPLAGAVRAARLLRQGLRLGGRQVRAASRRRRAVQGPAPLLHARAHDRPLLADGRHGRRPRR